MKKHLFTLCVLCLGMTMSATEKESNQEVVKLKSTTELDFGLSTTNLVIDAAAGSTGTVTFSLPSTWQIVYDPMPTSQPTWFTRTRIGTLDQPTGYTYTCVQNTGADRSVRLKFTAPGYTTSYVTITQKGTNATPLLDIAADVLTLSPNPTETDFEITSNEISEVSIYSITGDLLFSKTIDGKANISTSSLSSGVYVIKTLSASGIKLGRLVKK